jgi:CHAT domain-containing protein
VLRRRRARQPRLAGLSPVLAVLLAGALAAWAPLECRASASPDPAALYQSIRSDFVHGSLAVAHSRAAMARQAFLAAGSSNQAIWELKFRLLDAEILLGQKQLQEVIALLTDGAAFPPEGDLAIKRDLLCSRAHDHLGRAQESDQELREARRLAELSHSPLMGDVLRAEALVQRDAGHWDKALEKFKASLAVAREHGDPWLETTDLVDLGHVSLQDGHYDQAVAWSEEAAKSARSIQAPTQIQSAVGNTGWAYVDLGDFQTALANFQEAERLATEMAMTESRVLWLQDAGLADYKLGNLDEARHYDEEALQIVLTLPAADEVEQIVNIETNLALLLLDEGRYDAAQSYSDKAVLAARDTKDANVVAYAMFLQGLLAARRSAGEDAQRLLMRARQLTTDSETRMEIENAMANLHSARHEPRQAEQWYRRSTATFERNRSAVGDEALRLPAFAYGGTVYRDYAQFLIDAHRPSEALQLLDRSRARTLEEGLGFASAASDARGQDVVDAQALSRKLDAPILFYSLGPEKSYLWAITARETQLLTLPKERDIRSLVEEYQKAIQKSIDPLQTASPAAIALYETLIKPAAAMIPHGAKILLIPDGVLHSLNFETLLAPSAQGLKYWIEDVTVTTTSSIRILSRLRAEAVGATARDLLLIGDPVAAGREFEALPNAPAEIERIEQHFSSGASTVLTQARAMPAAYTASGPEQFRYIHFVAHGTASRLSPLDSAVVLSPPPSDPADFKLYAREIVQHPLHARLVTISACYGSGIRNYAGEGLVGLAWAFLRAGSHNVIGALWLADDASTPVLMDRLYAELQAGKAPDAALRTAKLALIHSPNVYRKPFYWGVFQLYAGA